MDKDSLLKLLTLQEKEERVLKLLREKEKILEEINTFEKNLEDVNSKINDINKQKESIEHQIENFIKSIENYEQMLNKISKSLKTAKNKELYKNILREKSKTENAIINTRNLLKQAYTQLNNLEHSKEMKELMSRQKFILEELNNLKEDLENMEISISKAQKDLEEYRASLDKSLVDFYEDVKNRVIPVFVPIDKKACSYCGTILPLDFYNRLIQNNIYTFMCPNCQRIIYKHFDIIK